MNRTTQELMNALLSKGRVEDYLRENEGEMLSDTLASCLDALLSRHGLKKGAVIEAAQIERSYGYQLFSGRRGTPSRDVLLSLALAMHLSVEETQTLLRTAGLAMLYPRVRRDSVILRALADGASLMDCNDRLDDCGEPALGD